MTEEDELIAADAARYLQVTRARIRALVRDGRLVGRVVAGKVRVFSKAELDAYKAERDQRPQGGRPKKEAGPLMGASPAYMIRNRQHEHVVTVVPEERSRRSVSHQD